MIWEEDAQKAALSFGDLSLMRQKKIPFKRKDPEGGRGVNSFSILLVGDWDLQLGGSCYLKGQAGGDGERLLMGGTVSTVTPRKKREKGLGEPFLNLLAH